MRLEHLMRFAIRPAMGLLPAKMRGMESDRLLMAIALQESDVKYRRQSGNGPARGYWQFEKGGVLGVLNHPATSAHAREVCAAMDYAPYPQIVLYAMENNDMLAAAFARLNLWWLPSPIATTEEKGLEQYLEAWRPGKPHPEKWPDNWRCAVEYFEEEQ